MRARIKRVRVKRRPEPLKQFFGNITDRVGRTFSQECEREIDEQLIASRVPPLSPATIARKGHSLILIETGRLKQSYNYRRYGYYHARIGVFRPSVAKYAVVHEFGATRFVGTRYIVIPPRPVLRYLASKYVFIPRVFMPAISGV